MRSLRTKITSVTIFVLIVAVVTVTITSVVFLRNNEQRKSNQLLLLLCETGARNLDYYFNGTQKSVAKVASYAEADIDGLDDIKLKAHMERVRKYFGETASKTGGVLTYYYRIDPAVSQKVKGFWYTDLTGNGFTEHEVTDITKYDTEDTSKLVWFTVPKQKGEPIWLSPYITDNLDKRVISYNVPVYFKGKFVGVVGIEIDYSTMAEQVESIKLFNNGYAFLSDSNGNLFYHPRIDVSKLDKDEIPSPPDGVLNDSTFIRFTYNGEEKVGAWLPLGNGMRMNVVAPVSETEGDWQTLIWNILIVALEVIAAASIFTMFYTKRISKPIKELTKAAEQVDRGNYEFSLDYNKDDEVGKLTKTFMLLSDHMKNNIMTLNQRVFVDALTQVKNKGAFSKALENLQTQTDKEASQMKFAIGVFDCDNLKVINDKYGHDKGDIYLQTACHVIGSAFTNSVLYRIGGDEFSVILRNEDFENREALAKRFEDAVAKINDSAKNEWEQVHVSMGIAEYDPENDSAVIDTMRRADKIMYENKRLRKKHKAGK